MWELENTTPFAAQRALLRDPEGARVWVVVVKATYSIMPDGSLELADEQQPVSLAPVFRGEPGQSSLRQEADLALARPTTDVLVNGQAHAPEGAPVTQLTVSLQVGELSKKLQVFGDTSFVEGEGGVVPGPAALFTRMPLVYERALGGQAADGQGGEPRNPVGVGFALQRASLVGTPAPNLRHPEDPLGTPAALGPVARHWSPRKELFGTHDEAWERERLPLLPEDFDPRALQCAPADQQTAEHLRGGERVLLENLTPGGRLELTLPRLVLTFRTQLGPVKKDHLGLLQTVLLEPDLDRLVLVWQSQLPCHQQAYQLRKTEVRVMEDIVLTDADLEQDSLLMDDQPTVYRRPEDDGAGEGGPG